MKDNKKMTVGELTSKAGKATLAKYGRDHYVKMAEKSNAKQKSLYSKEEMKERYQKLSQSGIAARQKKRRDRIAAEADPADGKTST